MLVSGLDLGFNDIPPGEDDSTDMRLQLLVEYLKAESGGPSEQDASRRCSALVILGNSLDVPKRSQEDMKGSVRSLQHLTGILTENAGLETVQRTNNMGSSTVETPDMDA